MNPGRQILVVDDEPILVRLLTRMLTNAGYRVTSAQNGVEALERVSCAQFDLVLCDVRMPVMDGPSFLASLRAQDTTTPLVFLTGYGDYTYAELRVLGATAVYTKPIAPHDLLDAVALHARGESIGD